MLRLVIACGGTGGHFYPGYALGKSLRSRGHEVVLILRAKDAAKSRLLAEDLPFFELDFMGMPRKISFEWLTFLWKLALSLRTTLNALRAFRPNVVVGMGGYLTFPVALAARLARIPYILHESNSVLGLANHLCLGGARTIALGLPLQSPVERSVLTGTPIREELWTLQEAPQARKRLGLEPELRTLLIFGGSQGARAINQIAPKALKNLAHKHPGKIQVLHLSGELDEAQTLASYSGCGFKTKVLAFLQEMQWAYAAADMVLCRSGASTLTELIAQSKPALLIPYPSATDAHQQANAGVLAQAGAAIMLEEKSWSEQILRQTLEELLITGYPEKLRQMALGYATLKLPSPQKSLESLVNLVETVGSAPGAI